MIDRRAFLTTVGAGIAVAPLVGEAQRPGKVHRIGFLMTTSRAGANAAPGSLSFINAILQELNDLGYREGQNVVIQWRSTDAHHGRRLREATALVQWNPDVVFVTGQAEARVMRDLSKSLPIVVGNAADLVGTGLAESLARPGGNVTGQQLLSPELVGKRVQLIKELVPRLERFAVLHHVPSVQATAYYERIFAELEVAARPTGIQFLRLRIVTAEDFTRVFAEMRAVPVQAVLVLANPFMNLNTARTVELALGHRLPLIVEFSSLAEAGALASYGPSLADGYRRAVRQIDRILKGTNPGEIPIEQPTRFEMVINVKTAKALGLTIPQSVLMRADRVIQ